MKGAGQINVTSIAGAISDTLSKKQELDRRDDISSPTTPGGAHATSGAATKLIDKVCEASGSGNAGARGSYSTGRPVAS